MGATPPMTDGPGRLPRIGQGRDTARPCVKWNCEQAPSQLAAPTSYRLRCPDRERTKRNDDKMTSMRYICRRMIQSPGFSAMVIAMVALAVGANLGIYCVSKSVLSHSLGIPDSDRLVYFSNHSEDFASFSGPGYEALRATCMMKDIFAWKSGEFRLQTPEGTARVNGAFVTGNTFSVLRIRPAMGRFFGDEDDARGGGKDGWTGVLGYSYWRSHFGASASAIGTVIHLDGAPVRIIGVLPREFTGISIRNPGDIVMPRHFMEVSSPRDDRFAKPGYFEWSAFGRLPPGTALADVQANLSAIEPSFRRLADPREQVYNAENFPDAPPGKLLIAQEGRLGTNLGMEKLRMPAFAIEGLGISLLLFCTCNLILLFAGRSGREAHTRAIRQAMGARLRSEVHFAVLEVGVLTAFGCVAAVPIAWSTALLVSRAIQSSPGFNAFSTIKPSIVIWLAASVGAIAISCLTVALVRTWQGRGRVSVSLRSGLTSTPNRSGSWVIGVEALVSILLATSVVMNGIGFQRLASQRSGFDSAGSVMASLDLDRETPEAATDKESIILERIRHSPGVQFVATTNIQPLSGAWASEEVSVLEKGGGVRHLDVWPAEVSGAYLSAIGTRIVRGRNFDANDLGSDRVCVLSERAASALFPARDPINEIVREGSAASTGTGPAFYCRVIGIAEDAHLKSMFLPADSAVYRLSKNDWPNLVVRAATSALAAQAVQDAARAVAPDGLAPGLASVQTHVEDDLRLLRVIALLGTICASASVAILCIGFFGVLSIQVTGRRREVGIRIALGASRAAVCLALLGRARRAVGAGFLLGIGPALIASSRLARVYGLNSQYALAACLGSLALLAVLLLAAGILPIARAFSVSPMECVRSE